MITPEEVAARFDNRTGFKIVSYGVVGLPIYRLTTVSLCLLKKKISPIEEFVLRSIAVGLKSEEEISGFLGLDSKIVSACISEFVFTEHVTISRESTSGTGLLSLTKRGLELCKAQSEITPREQTIVFYVDGLTRRPKIYDERHIYRKQAIRDSAIPDLPAFPSRPPQLKELNLGDIVDVVKFDTGREDSPKQLLKVNSIERVDRQFIEAVALIYRSDTSHDFQVAFAIEGRLSIEHEQAFSRENGIQRAAIFGSLRDKSNQPDLKSTLGPAVANKIEEIRSTQTDARALDQDLRKARGRLAAVQVAAVNLDDISAAESAENEANSLITEVERRQQSLRVRPLAVYEHVPLLQNALVEARQRLLITTPWVRHSVVNSEFLTLIKAALKRGVKIYLGLAIQEHDGHASAWDSTALADLAKIEKSSSNLKVFAIKSSDTRLLLVDRNYFVATSFNWLSYKGDPRRPFREELGTLVNVPELVDSVFATIGDRIPV